MFGSGIQPGGGPMLGSQPGGGPMLGSQPGGGPMLGSQPGGGPPGANAPSVGGVAAVAQSVVGAPSGLPFCSGAGGAAVRFRLRFTASRGWGRATGVAEADRTSAQEAGAASEPPTSAL